MDNIHFAPPKKPWKDDSPVNTNNLWFQPWFQSGAGFRPSTVLSPGSLGLSVSAIKSKLASEKLLPGSTVAIAFLHALYPTNQATVTEKAATWLSRCLTARRKMFKLRLLAGQSECSQKTTCHLLPAKEMRFEAESSIPLRWFVLCILSSSHTVDGRDPFRTTY